MQAFEDTPPRARRGSADRHCRLELVVALAAGNVIGYRNALPWRLPADLRRFRHITTGHAVLMGRRTWESIGRPLPQRQSIVVTRNRDFSAAGADSAGSLAEALARVRLPEPVYCIGGGELFALALPCAARIHLTEIAAEFQGDAFFPALDASLWREVARESHAPGPETAFGYAFITYDRVPAPKVASAA